MADRNYLGPGFNSKTLHEEEVVDDKDGGEEEDAQPFLAVVEKHGPCQLQIKLAADGTPFLVTTPTSECASQVFRDGMNLNCACLRSTKNVRGDFKCCLRLDAPQTWANPKSQKIVLCFMDEGEYFKAARSIREAQYEHFCRARLESQPAGAIQAEELLAAFSRSVSSGSTDIKVKIGDGEESVKCVSVDGEVLIIESKSKGFAGVLRCKRMMISTPGLPIAFLNSSTIAVPNRDANITFSFPDSFNRDIFALKLYFHSKGDPKAAWFSASASGPELKVLGHLDSGDVYLSASPLSTSSSSTPTASSSAPISSLLRTRSIKSLSTDTALISSALDFSGAPIYKQGFLHKQGDFVKSWKTRYFVLRPGDLSYFKSKDEALHGEVPLNTFFLKDATIEIVPFHKHDKSCVFEIEFKASSGNKNRTLVLEAESEADRTDWVDALISHLQTVSDHSRVVALEDVDQVTGLDGSPLSIDDFDLLCVLGHGAWGRVFAARHKHTNITFALKVMKKQQLCEQNAATMLIRERKIMSELLHPFILNLHGHFSTPTKLYMVLRLAPGGDVSKMIARQSRNNFCFSTSVARFVIAQVILAIEYMHGRGILHRDIKTENIVIDENGYCLLADMGLSCFCEEITPTSHPAAKTEKSSVWAEPSIKKHENHLINQRQGSATRANRSSFLGTPEYIAPELLNFKRRPDYGASADWWAVGILLYELLNGCTPFQSQTPEGIYSRILREDIDFGSDISDEARDVIQRLCTKDPAHRMCCTPECGVDQLRSHAFFRDFDWTNLFCRRMPSPFRGLIGRVNVDARVRDSILPDTLTEQQQVMHPS